jgi:hypothetical protein
VCGSCGTDGSAQEIEISSSVFDPPRCFLPTFCFFARWIFKRFCNSKNDVNAQSDFLQPSFTHHHAVEAAREEMLRKLGMKIVIMLMADLETTFEEFAI